MSKVRTVLFWLLVLVQYIPREILIKALSFAYGLFGEDKKQG